MIPKLDKEMIREQRESAWIVIMSIVLSLLIIIASQVNAQIVQPASIDMDKIMLIESSGCKRIKGDFEDARGCYQITKDALYDWNIFSSGQKHTMDDLWNAYVSSSIADWYINKRIPQMIRYYGKPVTVENIIIAYNAGISYVKTGKSIPKTTREYLRKYYE